MQKNRNMIITKLNWKALFNYYEIKMKKLSLMIMLLMGTTFAMNLVCATDDLDELDGLDDTVINDDTANDDISDDDISDDDISDDDIADDEATNNEKVELSLAGNVENWIARLEVVKIDNYDDYKVYYTEEWTNTVLEKEFSFADNLENKQVISVEWLKGGSKYTFVVKAFDNDGNPIESTASESLEVTVPATDDNHNAASDNVIYDPVLKVDWKDIHVSYKPGNDVKKVQISISEDGKTFKPVATIDATQTSYTIHTETTGKKFVKLVPIAEDGTLWVCKIGATDVQFITADVEAKKPAEKNIWKPKTGPETYLLIILAVLAYIAYSVRKLRA